MNLFDVTKTNIILNEKKESLSIEEVFDANKYQHFLGVTYSVSPQFLNKYLKNFSSLSLVVGIPEESQLEKANAEINRLSYEKQLVSVLEAEAPKFFQELSFKNQLAFQKNKFQMWAPSIGFSIHSKFYLLWNEDQSEKRVILGSANLSNQAFNNQVQQLEEVLIFDNHPLFALLEKRFKDDISQVITPYFPKKLLKIKPQKMTTSLDKEISEAIILTSKDLNELKEEQIVEKLTDVEGKVALGILPAKIFTDLKELPQEQPLMVDKWQEKLEKTETVYELSKEIISKRTKEPKLVAESTLKKNIRKKITVKITQQVIESDIPKRPQLISAPSQRNVEKELSGLFIQDAIDEKRLLPFGKVASKEEIMTGMKVIQTLLKNYEKYTVNYEAEYGTRIFEAILYTFTAPFIYEMKNQAKTVESAHDIPQFLFLGGNAGSGKSSLLRILSKMTTISPNYLAFLDYDDVVPKGEHNRKLKIVQQLSAWIQEENVSPLLVDEIPNEFFAKDNYGEELIVTSTNFRGRSGDASPVFIGTTNTDNYSLPERAARRSYYLRIDKPFDEEFRAKTNQAYNDLLNGITTDLYQDFILRFAKKMEENKSIWEQYEEKGKIDFLYYAREVFKDYYELLEQPLPIYFPLKRFDDSQESNQEKWRKLYLGSSHDDFHYHSAEKRLIFKITSLDENLTLRYGDTKPSVLYKKALPPKVVFGSLDSIDIELYADKFFNWIGVQNPYEKKSWLTKILNK